MGPGGRTRSVGSAVLREGRQAGRGCRPAAAPDNPTRSDITFDVGEPGAFSHATLRVFGRVASAATPAVDVTIYAVNDTAWAERTVTWNTRPDLGALLGRRSVVGTAPKWLE